MTDQTALPPAVEVDRPVAKATVSTGGPLAALVPQSLDEAFRLAKALSMSGDMVPKPFQDKPEAIMAAIARGMEIGLAPMQALASIAVINGRASLWGDALPALMFRAGHNVDVAITGEGDARVATATLTRGDTGAGFVRSFSVVDAKKAQLWGKAGPWQNYPERMLSMRARSLAIRDGAPDALMGLQVAEEVQDYAPMKDVTPPAPTAARQNLAQRLSQPAPPEPVEPHWTASVAWDEAFPGSHEWDEGANAAKDGIAVEECPYDEDRGKATDWLGGWNSVQVSA